MYGFEASNLTVYAACSFCYALCGLWQRFRETDTLKKYIIQRGAIVPDECAWSVWCTIAARSSPRCKQEADAAIDLLFKDLISDSFIPLFCATDADASASNVGMVATPLLANACKCSGEMPTPPPFARSEGFAAISIQSISVFK